MTDCKELIDISSLRLYKGTTLAYIDLYEEFKVFQDFLEKYNKHNYVIDFYAARGAAYVEDTEELQAHDIVLTGTVDPKLSRTILSFCNIPRQRYKLEIVKNGHTYIKFIKRTSGLNNIRNRHSLEKLALTYTAETMWLKPSVPVPLDNIPPSENAGHYDTVGEHYDEAEYSSDGDVIRATYFFVPESESLIYWELTATTTGDPIKLLVNGTTIELGTVPFADIPFRYSNIPFYSSISLDGTEVFDDVLKGKGPILENYFVAEEVNSIEVEGLKDIQFVWYGGFGLI